MKFSPQQTAFINWAETGQGSCVLEAVAGAGKTTTILEAARRMNGQIAILAYNKKIADEIQAKIKGDKHISAGTVHSFGLRAFSKAFGRPTVDGYKVPNLVNSFVESNPEYKAYEAAMVKLISFAKQRALGVLGSIENMNEWFDIVSHFDVFGDIDETKVPESQVIAASIEILKISNANTKTIDYDDMVYLPVFHHVGFWRFDVVMVDEAQDTNPARRALVRALVKKGGRVIAVGDRAQAIYGFCHPINTQIKTPNGYIPIQDLKKGDGIIGSTPSGELIGFKGNYKIEKTHQFFHSGLMITLSINGRKVNLTPHHKVPVHIGSRDEYYTYLMCRNGIYRIGHCQAFTAGDFMLTHRLKTEKADTAWILGIHSSKEQAKVAESRLLLRIKGTSFNKLEGDISDKFPSEEIEAMKILAEHGRMVDFPLISPNKKPRIALTGTFITEACNIIDGMRLAFYDPNQAKGGKHGQRQSFIWTPCTVSSHHYSGTVYGLTLEPKKARENYDSETWPLYFAGDDILVHNTGADSDSLDQIRADFSAIDMPLTTTYRCPKAIVRYAQKWVSHIEAHESAPEGQVGMVHMADFMKRNDLNGQSVVLCRLTAPIVSLAFKLLRNRVACKVEGREIGNGLKKLANRWKVKTTEKLREKLADYKEHETTKALAKRLEDKAQQIEDQVETLLVIIDNVNADQKHEVKDVVEAIETMFADDAKGILTLSTIHKSKGREWETVFWLDRAGTCPSKYARQEWQKQQERNLMYVAATRAKNTLYDLIVEPKEKDKGE